MSGHQVPDSTCHTDSTSYRPKKSLPTKIFGKDGAGLIKSNKIVRKNVSGMFCICTKIVPSFLEDDEQHYWENVIQRERKIGKVSEKRKLKKRKL